MGILDLVVFAAALALAAASPGPSVIALVARTLVRGREGAALLVAGIVLGDMVWLAGAALGLAALAVTLGSLFFLVRLAAAAYLIYLAYKLWTAPAQPAEAAEIREADSRAGLFLTGLGMTLGNPKAMAFYLALLPSIVDLNHLTMLGFAELCGVISVVLTLVFGSYVALAHRARHLAASPRGIRLINRTCGTAMAGAAVLVATK
ncbi:Lysine exporter protein (LYSE/YGGA) [Ancylobacter novellus DSM 506]|uniref:Lysine exporter protein (LYSE/YGGA) n=1 Tax=Ancylobacter novellus (strain ATCC 8093 / DSM 506 / JCM 20403 / CCM 1077 / IAM 12100 / NBRC 12443 / NCIMB 10456) TaxID=639283 RepID=D7A488_ANCN5|nr:LysE family translocator [Ancylobacter novellus]ADH87908.1 Lysine exporter protein (LYSE/YGGA) [Ancylobacter novellus DSM 506]